jgi:hypothetical protein
MNPNQPTANPSPGGEAYEMNDAVMKKLKSYRWKGRALTTMALGAGLLSIVAGIFLVWANSGFIFPQVRLLVQNSGVAQSSDTNSISQTNVDDSSHLTLSDGTTVNRQVMVTLMLGKAMNVTSLSVTLLGLGTLLTLLLVILNRQVTLRHLNTSLTQISNQIKELQDGKSPGAPQ